MHSKKPHPKKPIGQHSPRPLHQLAWSWEPLNGASLNAGSGLQLQPRDMAKIGQVMLDGGRWRGTQIVSSDWVRESKPQAGCRVYGLERDTAVVSGSSERRPSLRLPSGREPTTRVPNTFPGHDASGRSQGSKRLTTS